MGYWVLERNKIGKDQKHQAAESLRRGFESSLLCLNLWVKYFNLLCLGLLILYNGIDEEDKSELA